MPSFILGLVLGALFSTTVLSLSETALETVQTILQQQT